MTKPQVSIVIVTYNNTDQIEQAVSSVCRQSNSVVAELLVIDDHSEPKALEKLKELKNEYEFTLHINKENLGPSASRNRGIRLAKASLISFLDSDDYWLDERLSKTLEPFSKNKDIDVVYADAYMEYEGKLTKTRQSDLMPPLKNGDVIEHLFRRNSINMCAITMKTGLARKVMFDETLRSAEDYDFWLRVAGSGGRFFYVDEPLVVYRIHQSNLSGKRLLSIDSALKVLDKNSAYAITEAAKKNLLLHRQSLLEDRLKLQEIDILETLSSLEEYRKLGKRESLIKVAASINQRAGNYMKEKLIK